MIITNKHKTGLNANINSYKYDYFINILPSPIRQNSQSTITQLFLFRNYILQK